MQGHTIQQMDQKAHQPVAQAGLGWHCSTFGPFAHPRADDKVRTAFAHWSQHQGQVSGIITSIPVHKNNHLGPEAARRFETLPTGSSIAAERLAGNDCSPTFCHSCCSIPTAVVDHDHPLREIWGKLRKQAMEGCFLIQRWYDKGNLFGDHTASHSSTHITISNTPSSFVIGRSPVTR